MFFISYGCANLAGTASFRVPWAVQAVPAMLLYLGLVFLPESPRWLAKHNRWDESLAVLTLVHGHGDSESPFVRKEMSEIRAVVEFEAKNADVTYLELFKPKMLNRTSIGVFTQIWSQLTGMNVMVRSQPRLLRRRKSFHEQMCVLTLEPCRCTTLLMSSQWPVLATTCSSRAASPSSSM